MVTEKGSNSKDVTIEDKITNSLIHCLFLMPHGNCSLWSPTQWAEEGGEARGSKGRRINMGQDGVYCKMERNDCMIESCPVRPDKF